MLHSVLSFAFGIVQHSSLVPCTAVWVLLVAECVIEHVVQQTGCVVCAERVLDVWVVVPRAFLALVDCLAHKEYMGDIPNRCNMKKHQNHEEHET